MTHKTHGFSHARNFGNANFSKWAGIMCMHVHMCTGLEVTPL
jgi:hypothetical protein